MRKNAKAKALGRAGDGEALLSAQRYHEMAVRACGISDADLARAGQAIKDALGAEKMTVGGPVPDWDVRLKAATTILNVRGVRTQPGTGGGTGNDGGSGVTLNVVMAGYAALPERAQATIIEARALPQDNRDNPAGQ